MSDSFVLLVNSEGMQQEHTSFIHKFVDVGAAALLVGDMEAKVKGHSLKYPSVKDISGLHKLLQPAAVTAVANLASAPSHLKAITFVKRVKPGSFQPWYLFRCGMALSGLFCLLLLLLSFLMKWKVIFSPICN